MNYGELLNYGELFPQIVEETMEIVTDIIFFSGGSDSKASACNTGDPVFNPWVGKIPWRRKWQPTPVLLPGKSHGQRTLVGYSPWGRKESDMSNFTILYTTESLVRLLNDSKTHFPHL